MYKFAPSPHKSSRRGVEINAIVLHFTANATLSGTVSWFQSPKSRVSAHYVVGRQGDVVQMVLEADKAWHAGKSTLEGSPYVNSMSIGIELVNWGELKLRDGSFHCWPQSYSRKYDVSVFGEPFQSSDGKWWAPYTDEQREALVKLCRELVQRYPAVTMDRLVGHEDVAPGRKTDPGPALYLDQVKKQVFKYRGSTLPAEAYLSYRKDPSEEDLAQRQKDRAEPLSFLERLIAIFHGRRS